MRINCARQSHLWACRCTHMASTLPPPSKLSLRKRSCSQRRLLTCSRSSSNRTASTLSHTSPDGLDFYAILGILPSAEPREVRSAYHSLMRELHPDRAGSATSAMASASADLCVLINEIYEVLGDEESRATYDALSGFSESAVNPFLDTSFERDQVFVDEVSCIGCGKCVRHAMGTFEIEASKYGRARVINQNGNDVQDVQVAIETCPVDCIHWVSLPQLSLLEAALANMGRVEVFIMQRNQRNVGNVFQEANKAWERRQAAIAAARASSGPKIDWDFWGTGSLEREEREQQQQAARDPTQRRIANLAVAAAKSARMWRAYVQSRSALRSISDGSSTED